MRKSTSFYSGSALVFALICILILSILVAETLRLVTAKYQNVFHAASWQESLLAAESGVDLGMIELRKSITDPATAWQSPWSGVTPSAAATSYTLSSMTHGGEGGTKMTMQVSVDAPAALIDSKGWQYYRIRAIGTAGIPGPARVTDEQRDLLLRKLSLRTDRLSGQRLVAPQVSRRVEIIAKPVSPFNAAILTNHEVKVTSANIIIDSYDSRDVTKSTNGQYDAAKRQSNGDVMTNGTLITAGDGMIYGDLGTNEGTSTGISNVTGTVRTDFFQSIPKVKPLEWTTVTGNSGIVNRTTSRAAGSVKGATKYIMSQLNLENAETLTLTGSPTGATTYIELWVKGGISVTANAKIVIEPGVIATIYVQDDTTLAGNGIMNPNLLAGSRAGNTMIYGLEPTDGHKLKIHLGGNSEFKAGIYAPNADVDLDGGGNNGAFYGAVVADTATLTGVTSFHYDEAMTVSGAVTDYKITSWFENNR